MPQEALDEFAESTTKQVPVGRFGNVDEVAVAAVFLANPASSYIVGVELNIDGGLTQI